MKSAHNPPIFRRLLRPLPLISTTAVLLYCGWFVFGDSGLYQSHRLREKRTELNEQIASLESQRHELETYLAALKSKDEGAMEVAARNFGLVGPGETIYDVKVELPAKK